MTDDTSADEDSDSTSILHRRNVRIGLGVSAGGTPAALDTFTDVLEARVSNVGGEDPPLTHPNNGAGTAEPALQTPRTAASLVISVEWNDQDFNRQMPRPSGRNGRAPWTSADSQTPTWNESNSPPKSSGRVRPEGPASSDERGIDGSVAGVGGDRRPPTGAVARSPVAGGTTRLG